MVITGDTGEDVGMRAKLACIAIDDPLAQIIDPALPLMIRSRRSSTLSGTSTT